MFRSLSLAILSSAVLCFAGASADAADSSAEPIDFGKHVAPVLKKNCTACHNASKKEGSLILETPATILKGGDSGPAAVVGKGAESLLITRALGTEDEQMPPPDNKVGAKRLTAREIEVLKLWIDQGAKVGAAAAETIVWQPLPSGVQPIFAVALTNDGQYAACGRANQIFIYHVPTGRSMGRLTDPSLLKSGLYSKPGVADLDLIQALAFSPDGTLLASGGFRTIKLWRRPQATTEPLFGGPVAVAPTALAASRDGKIVAAAVGNEVGIWNAADRKAGAKLVGHKGTVTAVAFSADGTKIATASADKSLRIWNAADGKQLAQFDAPAEFTAVSFLADATQLAAGGADGKIRIAAFKAGDAKLAAVREFAVPGKRVTSLAVVPSTPTQVVSGDEGGNVVVWNTADGKQIRAMTKAGGEVTSVAVRADGSRIAATNVDKAVRVWNMTDGKLVGEARGDVRVAREVAALDRSVGLAKAAVAADKAAVADAEKNAKTEADGVKKAEEAKVAADKTLKEKTEAAAKATGGKQKAETAAKGNEKDKAKADALTKATKAAEDAEKAKSDASTAAQSAGRAVTSAKAAAKKSADAVPAAQAQLKAAEQKQKDVEAQLAAAQKRAVAAQAPLRSVAFSADGLSIAVGGDDKLLSFYSADNCTPLEAVGGAAAPITDITFFGNRIVAASADKSIVVRSFEGEWQLVRTIGDPASRTLVDRVTSLDFSPDGKLLASGGGEPSRSGELKLWNVADGSLAREVADAHSDVVLGVRFSPDGKHLASCGADKFLKVFNVADGKFVRGYEGHTHHVLGAAWSADGKSLASAGADSVLKLWDVGTGEQKRTVTGFTKEVTSLAFAGAGLNVVATSGDKSVRLVNGENGQTTKNYPGATDFVYCSAVTADGKTIIAGGHDGVLRIWNAETAAEIRTFAAPSETATQQAAR